MKSHSVMECLEADARIIELEAQLAEKTRIIREHEAAAVRVLAHAEAAEALAEMAEKKASVFKNERDFYEDKLRREMKENTRLRAALEKFQWSGKSFDSNCRCPECHWAKAEAKHAHWCFIGQALRVEQPAESEKGGDAK